MGDALFDAMVALRYEPRTGLAPPQAKAQSISSMAAGSAEIALNSVKPLDEFTVNMMHVLNGLFEFTLCYQNV